MYGHTCCFCAGGSGAEVLDLVKKSRQCLGRSQNRHVISIMISGLGSVSSSRTLGESEPRHQPKTKHSLASHNSCQYQKSHQNHNKDDYYHLMHHQAQPNYVIKLEQDDGETQYLYTGDLW